MSLNQTIDTWIESHRQELTDVLARLIAADTSNPPGNEERAAAVVAEFFRKYGIPYETHEAAPGRTNILGTVGSGGKALFLPGHLDVVPAGEGWDTPAFEPVVRDGRMYGRGVSDDKGPTAAILLAGACLKECARLKGRVILGGVADEERGSALGLEFLLREKKVTADYAIVPDIGGNMTAIDIAEKGLLFVEIISHGRQVHGSTPELGVNAVWNLIHVLNRLREQGVPKGEHTLLGKPTMNLGTIAGGAAPNVVPARAAAVLDLRYLPGQSDQQLLGWIESVLRQAEKELPEARFELRPIQHHAATEVPAEDPLVQVIRQVTREVLGREAQIIGVSGATVTKQLIAHGISAVGFSAGDANQAHMANESISLDELVQFTRVLVMLSVRLIGAE